MSRYTEEYEKALSWGLTPKQAHEHASKATDDQGDETGEALGDDETLDLFTGPGQFHRGAPDTEVYAAFATDAEGRRRQVYSLLVVAREDGLTGFETCSHFPGVPEHAVRPRLTELKDRGLIVRTERKRLNARGFPERVWVASIFHNGSGP